MQEIDKEVSKLTGLPEEVVRNTYKAFWLFIKTKIEELPLKQELTEGEFNKLKTSFNLPYLGKLWCDPERQRRLVAIYKNKDNGTEYKED